MAEVAPQSSPDGSTPCRPTVGAHPGRQHQLCVKGSCLPHHPPRGMPWTNVFAASKHVLKPTVVLSMSSGMSKSVVVYAVYTQCRRTRKTTKAIAVAPVCKHAIPDHEYQRQQRQTSSPPPIKRGNCRQRRANIVFRRERARQAEHRIGPCDTRSMSMQPVQHALDIVTHSSMHASESSRTHSGDHVVDTCYEITSAYLTVGGDVQQQQQQQWWWWWHQRWQRRQGL
ncbi:hypothetical protein THASP1DRAFT_22671 [Thamnocephalis sphaerospora]|uniref:Uncharacterized protein n=1 Tax=Thamnocephalis sphaerospora TaxID=78915 RepID=A0A4P9XTJ3_9FUNG|nr:hypothetical protein THASP1DRAFT_22671 [Thamnocephalis sphaerospora]|eukprot:RKP09487.1 hypothetical protein THASP1DRAFT_22671 [Thamnocephalis sphaerospora]